MKMKKYIFFLVGLCCALLPAMADQPELLELKASDANIIGPLKRFQEAPPVPQKDKAGPSHEER
jgi:hypothetical protein